MRECDNSKIHKSRNFLFSICLIILDNLLLVLKNISCAMVGVPDAARCGPMHHTACEIAKLSLYKPFSPSPIIQ